MKGAMHMIRKTQPVTVEHARGGEGYVTFYHILQKEELMGHGTLYAKVVVNPHSSIGYHQHTGDTEPYFILSGKGIFTDNDRTRTEVGPGDACLIKPGESHGLDNPNDEPLEMMALILLES